MAEFVRNEPLFGRLRNVRMIVKANLVTYRGPTMVTNTLHAAAVLLREAGDWDWFVNLSASDYPLVTQDGTLGYYFLLLEYSSAQFLFRFLEFLSSILGDSFICSEKMSAESCDYKINAVLCWDATARIMNLLLIKLIVT